METAFLKPGGQLGNYRLDQKLALGGMAEIWSAWEEVGGRPGRRVALKVLQPFFTQDPALVAMFQDELRIAERLNHPGIVKTYGGQVLGDWTFQVMELLDGIDVRRILADLAKSGAWMKVPLVLRLGRDAALALEHAHRLTNEAGAPLDLVHRDVSPHNLMLTRDGQVKLIDFGIARASERMTQTRTGIIKGKLAYMAPEQATSQPVTPRTDIFALGVVLWELLTMRRLFRGKSDLESLSLVAECNIPKVGEYSPMLPDSAAILIEAMLAKDPEDRPSSMAMVAARLDSVLDRAFAEHDHSDLAMAQFVAEIMEPRAAARRVTRQFVAQNPEAAPGAKVADPAATPVPRPRPPTPKMSEPIDMLKEPSLPGGVAINDPALGLTFPGSLEGPELQGLLGKVQLREDSIAPKTVPSQVPPVEVTEAGGRNNAFDEPTEAVSASQPDLRQLLVLVDDTVLSNPTPTPPAVRPKASMAEAETRPAGSPPPKKPRPR